MGAYQSTPVTECESIDSENCRVRYGASSMQGWRRSQEDALNCCSDFDPEAESMLFAVYDGHGGAEVAEYCSRHMPAFIKQLKKYKECKVEEALVESFVEFDRTLTSEETINKLKDLAKRAESPVPPNVLRLARNQAVEDEEEEEEDDEEEEEDEASEIEGAPIDCDEDETAGLLEDACIPVEQVLQKLTNGQITGPISTVNKAESNTQKGAEEVSSTNTVSSSGSDGDELSGSGSSVTPQDSTNSEAGGSGTTKSKKNTSKSPGSDSDDDSSEEEYNEGAEEGESDSEDDDESEEMQASHELALKFTESEDYLELPGSDSGCTACLALIRGNTLYVANAGDSRCVLSRNGKAIDLSVDHKPEDPTERERIDKAGGFVTPDGRVNGNLNLSRAIGDHNYKRNKKIDLTEQMITPLPDIQSEILTPSDDFIIVACDGIWNSLTSQECVDFVKERLERGDKISQICEDLFHSVLADDTVEGDGTGCDNMTCIIIDLQKSTRPDPKNYRTSSTGFDHTLSDDLPVSPHPADEEPNAKKLKSSD